MVNYKKFQEAIEFLGIIELTTRSEVKNLYLKLSKKYHPDNGGNIEDFQKLKESYDIVIEYIDNFKYRFNQDEFKSQYPFFINKKDWLTR